MADDNSVGLAASAPATDTRNTASVLNTSDIAVMDREPREVARAITRELRST